MKKLVKVPCWILLFMLCLFSCRSPGNKNKVEYYSNGYIKKIQTFMNNEKESKQILFNEDGNIESITSYTDTVKTGEQLNFFEKKGTLRSKLLFTKNVANGVAYWFYESGSLKASRLYKNDREFELGFDYWNDSFVINKALVKFDENGALFYKINFNSSGNPVSKEGIDK